MLGDQTPIHDLPTGISRYKSHVWQAEASVGEAELLQELFTLCLIIIKYVYYGHSPLGLVYISLDPYGHKR